MDNSEEVIKNVEKRKFSAGSFASRIDKKLIIISIASIAIFIYLYTSGGITKQTLFTLIGAFVLVILVIGSRDPLPKVIPIEEAVVIMKSRLNKLFEVTDREVDVMVGNVFILYHVNMEPKSYDVLWKGTYNKKETTYVTEIDAIRGHLIKTREADAGWNCDKPTNTIVETRYVADSKFFDYEKGIGVRR